MCNMSWSSLLLSKFVRLMKAADARMYWGGDKRGLRTGAILRRRVEMKRASQKAHSFSFNILGTLRITRRHTRLQKRVHRVVPASNKGFSSLARKESNSVLRLSRASVTFSTVPFMLCHTLSKLLVSSSGDCC
jgi:hypothetical protein